MAREGQASSAGKPPSPAPTQPPCPPEVCVPVPKEKVLQDFKVLVQKVGGRPEVLLIGETLEGKDIHGLMSSFVKDLFSATCQPVHPGDLVKEPRMAASPCSSSASCGPGGCQLIFFLCRASCIKGRQAELHKILREVKQLVKKSPCALVGIITEAKKNEADDARAQLLRLLRGVFPKSPGRKRGKVGSPGAFKGPVELENIEVEAEIYVPGHPKGNLAIMKAACRASDALAFSRGPSCAMRLLKFFLWTAFIVGVFMAVCWYLAENDMLRPITSPSELFIYF